MNNLILKENIEHGFEGLNYAFYEHTNPQCDCIPIHWHKEYEIIYIKYGEYVFLINGKEYIVKSNEAIIIDSYSTHLSVPKTTTFNIKKNGSYMCYVFGENFIFPSSNSYIYKNIYSKLRENNISITQIINGEQEYQAEILHILNDLTLYSNNILNNAMSIQISLLSIFNLIIKNKSYFITTNKYIENNNIIRTALKSIQAHYLEDYKIKDLSNSLHLSVDYFINIFKNAVGITPKKYILDLRLAKAKELLLKSNEVSIADVAYESGFNDVNYFSRAFKKYTNLTPSEFQLQGK